MEITNETGCMLNYTCKGQIQDKNSLDITNDEYNDPTFIINIKYPTEQQTTDSNGQAILLSSDDLLTLQKNQAKQALKAQYNPIDVALNQNGEQNELIQGLNDIDGAADNDSLQEAQTTAISTMQNRLAEKSTISIAKKA